MGGPRAGRMALGPVRSGPGQRLVSQGGATRMTDRISAAWERLAPHLLTPQEPLLLRTILEDLYDGAQDDLMADLCTTAEAAVLWGVSQRRAGAHLAKLHEKYGYGRQVSSGAWIIRRAHLASNPPDAKYQPKSGP